MSRGMYNPLSLIFNIKKPYFSTDTEVGLVGGQDYSLPNARFGGPNKPSKIMTSSELTGAKLPQK